MQRTGHGAERGEGHGRSWRGYRMETVNTTLIYEILKINKYWKTFSLILHIPGVSLFINKEHFSKEVRRGSGLKLLQTGRNL